MICRAPNRISASAPSPHLSQLTSSPHRGLVSLLPQRTHLRAARDLIRTLEMGGSRKRSADEADEPHCALNGPQKRYASSQSYRIQALTWWPRMRTTGTHQPEFPHARVQQRRSPMGAFVWPLQTFHRLVLSGLDTLCSALDTTRGPTKSELIEMQATLKAQALQIHRLERKTVSLGEHSRIESMLILSRPRTRRRV